MKTWHPARSWTHRCRLQAFSLQSGLGDLIIFTTSDPIKSIKAIERLFALIFDMSPSVTACRFTIRNRQGLLTHHGYMLSNSRELQYFVAG